MLLLLLSRNGRGCFTKGARYHGICLIHLNGDEFFCMTRDDDLGSLVLFVGFREHTLTYMDVRIHTRAGTGLGDGWISVCTF